MMKVCSNCGHLLDDTARFCDECGTAIASEVNQETASAPAAPEAPQAPEAPAAPIPPVPPTAPQPQYQQAPPQYQAPQQPQYQQYQQMPPQYQQPQGVPPYQNYGYAPQAPVEEKASVGFAILSFFIPLAGLIIFLTQKDKKPKTAKASGIAAIIGFVLSLIISIAVPIALRTIIDNGYDEISSITEGSDFDIDWDDYLEDFDDDYEATAYDIIGLFDDEEYYNNFFDIEYELPSGFVFYDYDEISNSNGFPIDEETGVPASVTDGVTIYTDSIAVNNELGSTIQTMCVPKNDAYAGESLEEIVEGMMEGVESYGSAEFSGTYDLVIGDATFIGIDAEVPIEGVGTMGMSYYVTEEDGAYFMIAITAGPADQEGAGTYIQAFHEIEW